MSRVQQSQVTLQELLHQIHEGAIGIPSFQNTAIERPEQTIKFISKISKNNFKNEMVFIKKDISGLETKTINNSDHNSTTQDVILDGQQRLTALYRAFYGNGQYSYGIDLNKLNETGNIETAIHYEEKTQASLKKWADKMCYPLSESLRSNSIQEWLDAICDSSTKQSMTPTQKEELLSTFKKWVAPLLQKEISVASLPSLPLF